MHEFESQPELEQAADLGSATALPSLAQLMVQSSSPAFSLAGPMRRPWTGGGGPAWGNGGALKTIMSSNGGENASLEEFLGGASLAASSSSTPRIRAAAREGRSGSSRHSSGAFTASPRAAAGSSRPSSLLDGLSRYGPAPVLPLCETNGRGGQSSAPPAFGTKALAVHDGLREMIITTSGLVVLAEATVEKGGTEPTRPAGWDRSSAPAMAKEPRRFIPQFPIEGSVAGSAAGPFKDKDPSKRMLVRASCNNKCPTAPAFQTAFVKLRITFLLSAHKLLLPLIFPTQEERRDICVEQLISFLH